MICQPCRDVQHEKCPDYKVEGMPTKCFCLHRVKPAPTEEAKLGESVEG